MTGFLLPKNGVAISTKDGVNLLRRKVEGSMARLFSVVVMSTGWLVELESRNGDGL